jgi:DUF917 family protein
VTTDSTVERITSEDLEWLATGTAILGSGGGGSPRIGQLRLESLLEDPEAPDEVELIDPAALDPDATVTSVGQLGSPTIGSEKPPRGDEELRALRALEQRSDRTVDALVPGEIGGANSFAPLVVALQTGLPVVDADAMGRALPELQMDSFFIYGHPVNHAALTDEKGNTIVLSDIDSPERFESLARSTLVGLGGVAGYAYPLLEGSFVADYGVPNTLSLAREVGRRVHAAREGRADHDPVTAAVEATGGSRLFRGTVQSVERDHTDGFTTGEVRLEQASGTGECRVAFQNEYLLAERDGEIIATVPDIVSLLDSETGTPVLSDVVQFGQRVDVVGVPATDLFRTERALAVVGPQAFGYDCEYVGLDG